MEERVQKSKIKTLYYSRKYAVATFLSDSLMKKYGDPKHTKINRHRKTQKRISRDLGT